MQKVCQCAYVGRFVVESMSYPRVYGFGILDFEIPATTPFLLIIFFFFFFFLIRGSPPKSEGSALYTRGYDVLIPTNLLTFSNLITVPMPPL